MHPAADHAGEMTLALSSGATAQRHRSRRIWAVIQHVEYDGEGAIGHALRRAEYPWVSVRPFLGDPVPRVADLSGLIVLGAPDGSADDRGCAHLVAERRLICGVSEPLIEQPHFLTQWLGRWGRGWLG